MAKEGVKIHKTTAITFGEGYISMFSSNRKCQDYVYVKWEYWSTMKRIKHYLKHGNK